MAYSGVATQHNQWDLESCFAVSKRTMTVLKRLHFAWGGFEGKQVATNNSKHCAAVRDGEEEGKSLMADYFVSPWPSQRSTFFTAVIHSQFTETLASKGYPFENMVITIQLDWFLVFSWWFHHHKTFARSSATHEGSSKTFALLKYRQYQGKKKREGKGQGRGKNLRLSLTGLVYFPSIEKSTIPCWHDSVYASSKYF